MVERNIANLDSVDSVEPGTAAAAQAPPVKPPDAPVLVDVNYPDPTPLAVIIRDVSRWSGHCFVMEPSLNAKLQIFAPRRLTTADAYEIFLASLSVVNLRAVQVGKVVKVVSVSIVVAA